MPPETADRAYRDGALAIAHGQTISQPWIVARMSELLALEGPERVLEVGTGSGYGAAVLSRLCAPRGQRGAAARPVLPPPPRRWRPRACATCELRIGDGLGRRTRPGAVRCHLRDGLRGRGPSPRPRSSTSSRPARRLVCPLDRDGEEHLAVTRRRRSGEHRPRARFVPLVEGGREEGAPAGGVDAPQGPPGRRELAYVAAAPGVNALPKGHPDRGESLRAGRYPRGARGDGPRAGPVAQAGPTCAPQRRRPARACSRP